MFDGFRMDLNCSLDWYGIKGKSIVMVLPTLGGVVCSSKSFCSHRSTQGIRCRSHINELSPLCELHSKSGVQIIFQGPESGSIITKIDSKSRLLVVFEW